MLVQILKLGDKGVMPMPPAIHTWRKQGRVKSNFPHGPSTRADWPIVIEDARVEV
ncbi:hypothetical protein ACLB1Q_27795 [Escherichia coli]